MSSTKTVRFRRLMDTPCIRILFTPAVFSYIQAKYDVLFRGVQLYSVFHPVDIL